ncbi:MAG: gamma-glutamyl-gamma-aminobutyrate hydrolase family protein [Rickettsiales bacterium]
MNKPLIGILLDYDNKNTKDGGYSDFPWYALRTHYGSAVSQNEGLPIFLSYEKEAIKDYVDLCDGFIFPGGDFDVNPMFYGEKVTGVDVLLDDTRTIFEVGLMKEVLDADKPLLGICAGQQLLNVVLGGTLYHDVSEIPGAGIHKHSKSPDIDWHEIKIEKNSLLFKATGKLSYKVNSHHHQAVKNIGDNLIVNAKSQDGVIEGIEHTKKRFCLGVEWHPEYLKNLEDKKLFRSFIAACK